MRYRYKRGIGFLLVFCVLFSFSASSAAAFSDTGSYVSVENFSNADVSLTSEVRVSSRFYELLFKKEKAEDLRLIPGGEVLGIKLKEESVIVADAKDSKDLKKGDKLLSIDGKEIKSSRDVYDALSKCCGKDVYIEVMRGEEKLTLRVSPKEEDGAFRLGVSLKSGACGIGTVTFIDPETKAFGALGHAVCDAESGSVLKSVGGIVTGVILGGVSKGVVGKAGELSGVLTRKVCGFVSKNSECGIFGVLDNYDISEREAIPICKKGDIKKGEAEIISTVKNGYTERYKIEICDINTSKDGSKCFKIKVTDPTLIAITGGIVKGMSGSPIIQGGKLVGAVTHVMVANPTEGYGIFIENMLNAAQNQAIPKAA